MESTGLQPIGEYIGIRQANIAKKVACRTIYKICIDSERMLEMSRMVRSWDQDVVNEPE